MEHRSDSQQMDYRNDLKLRCDKCRGTGRERKVIEEAEFIVPCDECGGSGRHSR